VFPVDRERGTAGAPLEITPATLSRVPRACDADAEGWLLKTQPSDTGRDLLEPALDLGATRLRNVEVRLLASTLDLCVDTLAAQTESVNGGARKAAAAGAKFSIPLIVTERSAGGRRWSYRCTH
jgi:hypothetical protein